MKRPEAIWGRELAYEAERVASPRPLGSCHGMGPLTKLWVRRPGVRGVQLWKFSPAPRLFYDEARPKRRLFVLGGGYRVTAEGLVRDGASGLSRLDRDKIMRRFPGVADHYRDTHGGLDPKEAVMGILEVPETLVVVGIAEKIAYVTDRNNPYKPRGCRTEACEIHGEFTWVHQFGEAPLIFGGAKPFVCCDTSGRNLALVGGDYTIRNGWIVG